MQCGYVGKVLLGHHSISRTTHHSVVAKTRKCITGHSGKDQTTLWCLVVNIRNVLQGNHGIGQTTLHSMLVKTRKYNTRAFRYRPNNTVLCILSNWNVLQGNSIIVQPTLYCLAVDDNGKKMNNDKIKSCQWGDRRHKLSRVLIALKGSLEIIKKIPRVKRIVIK